MDAMLWSGWGDPAKAAALPPAVAARLAPMLGVLANRPPRPAVTLDAVRLPEPILPRAVLDELTGIVGDAHVRTGPEDRIRHTRGKSTVDLLRIRAGDADDAPDAVVFPADHEQILAVLRCCTVAQVAVVPFGGGTSAVGGLAVHRTGFAGVIALDLSRLDRLVTVDPVARTATFEPGVRAPAAESLLAAHGLTLGHFPQSFEFATIGGFAATRSSGQFSAGYGRFDEMVVGLRLATPAGTLDLGRAPRSAAGPDLRQLVLGSEGTLGVITAVTVRVRPVPAERVLEGWRFDSFPQGVEAVRRLAQDGPLPTVLRLADEYETALNLVRPGELDPATAGGCLAIVGHEGADVATRGAAAGAVLRKAGGTCLGPELGAAWDRSRFHTPYLRDALLDAGALAEALESAAFWSGLMPLYEAVRSALRDTLEAQGTPPLVLCHVSHVYETGASLYFTVVCAQADDPVAQWRRAKAAATAAILAGGATVSHHHGVGADHVDGMEQEVGELGLAVLRAVKARLDPAGILNPGLLLGSAAEA
jgi:alkyldihydroxyacetonephosphate synthase